ncbi:MAG: MCP four helix bundle domain-containing protein, partial [Sneathiella sp.]
MTEMAPNEKTSRMTLRINGKLLLSLSFLAAMSVVAGIVAWYSFDHISKSTEQLAHQSLPEIEIAMQLAQKSAEISASAPDLMANLTLEDHKKSVAELNLRAFELSALIEKSRDIYGDTESVSTLRAIERDLLQSLDTLETAVETKLVRRAARNAATEQLSRLHEAFLLKTEPLIDDAVFDFVMQGERLSSESTHQIADLVENSTRKVNEFLKFGGTIDNLEGVLSAVILASDLDSFGPLQTRYNALEAEIEDNISLWADQAGEPAFVDLARNILDFGRGLDNIFILKEQELWETPPGQNPPLSPRLVHKGNLLRLAHDSFHNIYTKVIADVVRDLNLQTQTESRTSRDELGELIHDRTRRLHLLLSLRAEGNLVSGILGEMSNVASIAHIEPFAERFEALEVRTTDMLAELGISDLQNITMSLLGIGTGEDNLFDIHRAELDSSARAAAALAASRELAVSLQAEVAKLVAAARERGHI